MNDSSKNVDRYWKKNIQIVSILMFLWFLASFGFGIIFVAIIFIYIKLMKNLDQEFNKDLDD